MKLPLLLWPSFFIILLAACLSACNPVNPPAALPAAPSAIINQTPAAAVTFSPTLTPSPKPTLIPTLPVELRGEVQTWPESTPEDQGMDSVKLAAMLKALQSDGRNIHSILVARHGVLILEVYFHPFNRETPHNLYSCTKSVTSAAVGLALQDGLISSVDTPAYSYFPDIALDDESKKTITLKHLLTMSSGLEWAEPLRSGLNDNWYILDSNSSAGYFFSRQVTANPGEIFNYNTGGSHLLSLAVAKAAGKKSAEYLEEKLFKPLGINRYVWINDANGQTLGGTGLALAPADMLRFGLLYRQRGALGMGRILPEAWVDESTRAQIPVSAGIKYGYQWWVRPNGIYNALGWGGQQIIVMPKQDMVVVITAGIRNASWNTYDDLLTGYLIPAARSSSALAANPAANAALKEQIRFTAFPASQTPETLPPLAAEISGKTYVDLNGTHGWSTFAFTFDRPDAAALDLMYGDTSEQIKAQIGLDGLFRVTETQNYGPLALKGYWKDKSTFVLTQQFLREAERITMEMTFTGNDVKRVSQWTVEDHSEESEAVLLYK